MRVLAVAPVEANVVVTDEKDWSTYRRSVLGHWERFTRGSWECWGDNSGELEAAYQTFISNLSPTLPAGGDDG